MSQRNIRRVNKSKVSKATVDNLELYQDASDNLFYYKDINGRPIRLITDAAPANAKAEMAFAASDQTTALGVASNVAGMFAEFDMTSESLFAGVGVLGTTSGGTRIKIQKNGVDMLTTVATIDFGEATSLTATTPYVIDPAQVNIVKGDRISVDIVAISGGATEAGLQIVLNGVRA